MNGPSQIPSADPAATVEADRTGGASKAASFTMQIDPPNTAKSLHLLAKSAEKRTGRPAAEMLVEAMSLLVAPLKLGPDEYFDLGLYDPRFTKEERKRFIGYRKIRKITNPVNQIVDRSSRVIDDKLSCAAVLSGFGLGVTETQALAARPGAWPMPVLPSADALAEFLRRDARYPLFGKPKRASQSVGAASIDRYDAERDRLVHHDGAECSVEEFAALVFEHYHSEGYLLQSRVRPNEDYAQLVGPDVGSFRILTLHRGRDVDVHYAVWKVPKPGAIADNYWRRGTMLVSVDPKTGVAERCVQGLGVEMAEIDTHPGTGRRIVGETLPHWDAIIDHVKRAGAIFMDVPMIGWDITMSADGPVFFEGNGMPHHHLYQTASGRGLYTPEFAAYLKETRERLSQAQKNALTSAKAIQKKWFRKHLSGLLRGRLD